MTPLTPTATTTPAPSRNDATQAQAVQRPQRTSAELAGDRVEPAATQPLKVADPSTLLAGLQPPGRATTGASAVVDGLRAAGFTCSAASAGATRCRGRVPGYPLPVNIFVPARFDSKAPLDVALHFHGFTLGRPREAEVFGRFDYAAMAARGGFNGVVVVPESEDRDATLNAMADARGGFNAMMDGVTGALAKAGAALPVRSIALSGHSGAYSPIAKVLGGDSSYVRRIDAVGLFDATYGASDRLARAGKTLVERGGMFVSINRASSPTSAGANVLAEKLTSAGEPRRYGGQLASRGAQVFHVPPNGHGEQHWQVFGDNYDAFLTAFTARGR